MAKYINISKLDVAKRQLETAISLFMNNVDIVSVHTLTAASYRVLRDLGRKQGIQSFIKDELLKRVKNEKQEEVKEILNKAENFSKHADRDADKQLKFFIGPTEFFLWDACRLYQIITSEVTSLIVVFRMWFFLKHPDLIMDEEIRNKCGEIGRTLNPEDRKQFLDLLPDVIRDPC